MCSLVAAPSGIVGAFVPDGRSCREIRNKGSVIGEGCVAPRQRPLALSTRSCQMAAAAARLGTKGRAGGNG